MSLRSAICGMLLKVVILASVARGPLQAGELAIDLPEDQRVRFHNPDGSCVQCSIGMHGCWLSIPAAEMLLWDTEYGPRERGGSGPERVARYCRERNLPVHNITGPGTVDWIVWSLVTGRGAAVLYGGNHFVTAVGWRPQTQEIAICDNNSPTRIQWMPLSTFKSRHLSWSGQGWCVILKSASAPARADADATQLVHVFLLHLSNAAQSWLRTRRRGDPPGRPYKVRCIRTVSHPPVPPPRLHGPPLCARGVPAPVPTPRISARPRACPS